MKKLVLVLCLFLCTNCVQAQQQTVPKLYADVDAACSPLLEKDGTIMDFVTCLSREFRDPFNYGPGWTHPVTTDIKIQGIGEAAKQNPLKPGTAYEEKQAMPATVQLNTKMWDTIIQQLRQNPQLQTQIFPAAKLKATFGY